MTWQTDDRSLYWEQRRLDAQQADAARLIVATATKKYADAGRAVVAAIEAGNDTDIQNAKNDYDVAWIAYLKAMVNFENKAAV